MTLFQLLTNTGNHECSGIFLKFPLRSRKSHSDLTCLVTPLFAPRVEHKEQNYDRPHTFIYEPTIHGSAKWRKLPWKLGTILEQAEPQNSCTALHTLFYGC